MKTTKYTERKISKYEQNDLLFPEGTTGVFPLEAFESTIPVKASLKISLARF
jgi:hypothetical protein